MQPAMQAIFVAHNPVWSVLDIVQNIPSILVFHGGVFSFVRLQELLLAKVDLL